MQRRTPDGLLECPYCEEPIVAGDLVHGISMIETGGAYFASVHQECFLRQIIGGVNHLKRHCICCGGSEPPDPPGLSRREAARAAVRYWEDGRRETSSAAD
jgi:hypothetical protein